MQLSTSWLSLDPQTQQTLENAGVSSVPGVASTWITSGPPEPTKSPSSWLVPALAFGGLFFLYKLSHAR